VSDVINANFSASTRPRIATTFLHAETSRVMSIRSMHRSRNDHSVLQRNLPQGIAQASKTQILRQLPTLNLMIGMTQIVRQLPTPNLMIGMTQILRQLPTPNLMIGMTQILRQLLNHPQHQPPTLKLVLNGQTLGEGFLRGCFISLAHSFVLFHLRLHNIISFIASHG
jgi:hypothetical protein